MSLTVDIKNIQGFVGSITIITIMSM